MLDDAPTTQADSSDSLKVRQLGKQAGSSFQRSYIYFKKKAKLLSPVGEPRFVLITSLVEEVQ